MKETLNQKLQRLAKESEKELRDIGLGDKLKSDIEYTINYRAKERLGQCVGKRDINISSWLLEIGLDHDIKNVIIHEILHTFEDTIGHKTKWKYYANYVNNRTDYYIERTESIDNIYTRANKVRPRREIHYKWEITCEKCGGVFYRQRIDTRTLDKFIEGKMIHKHCGGHDFKIVDIKKCEIVW